MSENFGVELSYKLASVRRTAMVMLEGQAADDIKAQIKAEVERVCTSNHLAETIRQEVSRVIEMVVKDSVEEYFQNGDGWKVVNGIVEAVLSNAIGKIQTEGDVAHGKE